MHGFGWGVGGLYEFFVGAAQVVGTVVIAGVLLGLAVLLARYLLVATKAAQLYVDLHDTKPSGPAPVAPAPEPVAPAPVAPEPAPAAPKPVRRTTKKPEA